MLNAMLCQVECNRVAMSYRRLGNRVFQSPSLKWAGVQAGEMAVAAALVEMIDGWRLEAMYWSMRARSRATVYMCIRVILVV